MSLENLRNIAIIAHVDHGKTTLVDKLLRQSQTLDARENLGERVMDSNDLERERGITILSKNTAIRWLDKRTGTDYRINIVDTPGHADFGGEVERVLSMVDCVCLLVDAADGPMPQTRFVTQKAFGMGLNPIVVVNKIDRPGARAHWVVDQIFDLFDRLGATDKQLDFPIVYASALNGYAGDNPDIREGNMDPLFQAIVDNVPPPKVNSEGPFQMQVTSLAYSSYVGVIGTGRITRGKVKPNQAVSIVGRDGAVRTGKVLQVLGFMGLDKIEVPEAEAGDIVAITGIADLGISETICDLKNPEQMATLLVDEPTMSMMFEVNKSPFAGKEGKFVTSRQIGDRLQRELKTNVALRVEQGADVVALPVHFCVIGLALEVRGDLLHCFPHPFHVRLAGLRRVHRFDFGIGFLPGPQAQTEQRADQPLHRIGEHVKQRGHHASLPRRSIQPTALSTSVSEPPLADSRVRTWPVVVMHVTRPAAVIAAPPEQIHENCDPLGAVSVCAGSVTST